MNNGTTLSSQSEGVSDDQARQMIAYLEDLLMRQMQRLQHYDLEGAIQLAQESQGIADRLSAQKIFARPGFAQHQERIQKLYKDVCLAITSQRQEVQGKLGQIRTGLKTLNSYAQS
jgi:hypothetical protein